MALIDTHCHFDMLREPASEALAEAVVAGVEAVVAVGIDMASSIKAAALARDDERIYATVGVHPHDAVHFEATVRTGLQRLLAQERVVAVGECGLDFYRDFSPRDAQRAAFVEQLELAGSVRKPVVVHSREAAGETFALLTEHAGGIPVIMHCFSTPDYVDLCNERGYYVSFAGNVTYKNAGDLQRACGRLREDLLLVETDAPFLTPVPLRGRQNRPANVALTAAFVAALRGWDDARVAAVTTANARRAFGLQEPA